MIQFDETLIQKEAENLYKRARDLITIYALLGAIVGVIAGYVATRDLGLVAGVIGLIGAALGAVAGKSAGAKLRFDAQMLLCQLQIEKNTRK